MVEEVVVEVVAKEEVARGGVVMVEESGGEGDD